MGTNGVLMVLKMSAFEMVLWLKCVLNSECCEWVLMGSKWMLNGTTNGGTDGLICRLSCMLK